MALSKAAQSYPELYAKHIVEGIRIAERARGREPFQKSEAVGHFERIVAYVRARYALSNTQVMSRAVQDYPAEFQAYQRA